MFELTREEIDFVKSQIVTSPNDNWYSGQGEEAVIIIKTIMQNL